MGGWVAWLAGSDIDTDERLVLTGAQKVCAGIPKSIAQLRVADNWS